MFISNEATYGEIRFCYILAKLAKYGSLYYKLIKPKHCPIVFLLRYLREQLDKENSRCKENGEKENERLREEVGTKACIVGKIVRSRKKWTGHISE